MVRDIQKGNTALRKLKDESESEKMYIEVQKVKIQPCEGFSLPINICTLGGISPMHCVLFP